MKNVTIILLMLLLLSSCTSMQRGGMIGALIGAGAGAGIGAAGGGVGVAIGAGAGAGAGLLVGAIAGEVYEVHRARMLDDFSKYNRLSGEANVKNSILARYEKQLALMETRAFELKRQNERLIAASYNLSERINHNSGNRIIQIANDAEGNLQITILSEILFDSGSATLNEAIYPVLDEVGTVINAEMPNTYIAIEGHCDSDEINDSGSYNSNWELSAARALSVLHYLAEVSKVDPKRMGVSGYSYNRPAASNDTAEGKSLNRRVVITVVPNNVTY